MYPWLPLVFIVSTCVFEYLAIRSWKPIYNNPVVFHDGGNVWLNLLTGVSFGCFAISMFWLAITSQ